MEIVSFPFLTLCLNLFTVGLMRGADNEVIAVSQAEYFSHNKQVVLRHFVPDKQKKKLVERSLSPSSNRRSSNF